MIKKKAGKNALSMDVKLKMHVNELKKHIRKSGHFVPKDCDEFLTEFVGSLFFSTGELKYSQREKANVITCYCFRNNPVLEG